MIDHTLLSYHHPPPSHLLKFSQVTDQNSVHSPDYWNIVYYNQCIHRISTVTHPVHEKLLDFFERINSYFSCIKPLCHCYNSVMWLVSLRCYEKPAAGETIAEYFIYQCVRGGADSYQLIQKVMKQVMFRITICLFIFHFTAAAAR